MRAKITPVNQITGKVTREATVRARTVEIGQGFTSSQLGDFDTSNATDGSLLVYDANVSKFVATPTLENSNTTILGGGF